MWKYESVSSFWCFLMLLSFFWCYYKWYFNISSSSCSLLIYRNSFLNTDVIIQFSSVTQSCPTLCDPMDCSAPSFPVHHQFSDLAQTQCPSSWWCHPTISSSVIPFSSCLQSFPASGSFPKSQFFALGGRSIGVSTSTSLLPMNIQIDFL